ncbi:Dihydroanticapsin 7-dehydrogenase [Acaryochloris thomasi RCC1774]|uniref:Dihydroanticapsin 7-dehydrogenase n=1 Tax=Acaryochloris thomasi RCC1774 TaxID=1764569 RepID=A0A2W1JKB0_9CYAN|nr:glucose 1-dehydrogenase [Acaryochloris thomasi]PZD73863.1 Dihydroanticapsin 7-dehydrogenase [Acaryochloris thomasi RCC1774]
MGKLDGKVALITGIGSGIGRAAAQLFCEAGATVFGVDHNSDLGASVAEDLESWGDRFHFHPADLSQERDCIQVVEECQRLCDGRRPVGDPRIDILYNNAGISIIAPFTETDSATLTKIMAVNFQAVYLLCQQVLPIMQAQGSGVIINTASELAIVAQPLYAAYCASKGAVLSLTRALALEYAQDNIRINALCPGPVDTPMLQQEFEQAESPTQARSAGIETIPIGRLGYPEEIAQVALYLASDAPALLHGASLVVDGGKTIL